MFGLGFERSNTMKNGLGAGTDFPVEGMYAEEVSSAQIFRDWKNSLGPTVTIRRVIVQSVDFFGSGSARRIGFIKFIANIPDGEACRDKIVLLRGGTVAILLILECEGDEYVVITEQMRLPAGDNHPELPAGMLDGSGKFAGVAAREIEEELGITIHERELTDLTAHFYGNRYKGAYTSAGLMDEFLRIFFFRQQVSRAELVGWQGKKTGLASEHEDITLRIIPRRNLAREVPDVKALSAMYLYERYVTLQ
jgi:ADP-sugar diphosphatase